MRSRITLLLVSCCFLLSPLFSAPSLANQGKTEKVLRYCSNFGDGVSFGFSSCANSNFSRVGIAVGRALRYCFNSGQDVSFSFTSCINSNFQSIESASQGNLYLRYCSNFSRDRLDFSFISCVNSNFSQISLAIPL
jgi:hypothetical protein